jgi:arginine-tRNA-protein transferase
VTACKPWTTEEQYALLRRYLAIRHPGGGMAEMDESDFADMVEQTPVRTYVIEYREPSVGGRPGKLVGACLSDQQADGMSMIYSFYDVGEGARRGLGTYIILDHITRAARAGLPYVYLGYWVEGSERMAYKASFKPMERLGRDGWRPMDSVETATAPVMIEQLPTRTPRRILIDA